MPSNSIEYIRKNYKKYWGNKKNRKKTALRVKAQRAMAKAGKSTKGDGKDIDHKIPLSQGGTSDMSNLRLRSVKKNRADGAGLATLAKKRKKKKSASKN